MKPQRIVLVAAFGFLGAACSGTGGAGPAGAISPVEWIDLANKLVSTLAILVAGWWAYFRFVRFRTLAKRVEFHFDWKTGPTVGTRQLGVLTVKLSNRGNTHIELRKDDDYRCTLGVGLIKAPSRVRRAVGANLRQSELDPLPYLFKAHKRIEPGETIDDVAVVFVDLGAAVAIQFNAQVLTLGRGGKREALMSSTVAFPVAPGLTVASASSEDEQDDYDEVAEVRNTLFGWIGEANALLSRSLLGATASERLETLLDEADAVLRSLVATAATEALVRARRCTDKIKAIVEPHMK